MRTTKPISERFWSKVQKTDGCWIWTGARLNHGHGKLGRGRNGEGQVLAHRLSYEINVGPIPAGLCVCHRCDNPPCVNPDHLFVGTKADNSQDMVSKGRHFSPFTGRTHCKHGHEFTSGNIRWVKIPRTGERRGRMCKQCERDRYQRSKTT